MWILLYWYNSFWLISWSKVNCYSVYVKFFCTKRNLKYRIIHRKSVLSSIFSLALGKECQIHFDYQNQMAQIYVHVGLLLGSQRRVMHTPLSWCVISPRGKAAALEGGHIASELDWFWLRWLLSSATCDHVLAYSIANRLRPPVDFFYAILYLRASFIDFILKKIMPRFSEDHFKNRPFIDFSACFERKATPTPCLWIRERWGRSFRQTLFWVKFYTLAYSRHFPLKQLCLACVSECLVEPPKVERGIFLILGGLFRLRSLFL